MPFTGDKIFCESLTGPWRENKQQLLSMWYSDAFMKWVFRGIAWNARKKWFPFVFCSQTWISIKTIFFCWHCICEAKDTKISSFNNTAEGMIRGMLIEINGIAHPKLCLLIIFLIYLFLMAHFSALSFPSFGPICFLLAPLERMRKEKKGGADLLSRPVMAKGSCKW